MRSVVQTPLNHCKQSSASFVLRFGPLKLQDLWQPSLFPHRKLSSSSCPCTQSGGQCACQLATAARKTFQFSEQQLTKRRCTSNTIGRMISASPQVPSTRFEISILPNQGYNVYHAPIPGWDTTRDPAVILASFSPPVAPHTYWFSTSDWQRLFVECARVGVLWQLCGVASNRVLFLCRDHHHRVGFQGLKGLKAMLSNDTDIAIVPSSSSVSSSTLVSRWWAIEIGTGISIPSS